MGTNFLSTTAPHLVKVTTTAQSVPEGSRVDQKSNESSKTGKVSAVVMVMVTFCKNKHNSQNAYLQKIDKLALNLMKLVLNHANLGQKHAKKRLTELPSPRAVPAGD